MAGLDIGVVQRVLLGPQHVSFEDQRVHHVLLLVRPPGFALDVIEGEIGIAGRLRRSS